MDTAFDASPYKQALVVLGAAGVVIPLFYRLKVSPVLGFMLVGFAVGPFGIASLAPNQRWLAAVTIGDPESIEPIAGLGVALLLFMIGLELSFERLWLMRRLVFGLGGLQIVLCASGIATAALALGQPTPAAIVIGLALAMSSTAVVIQVLSEEKRLHSHTGRASFAILLAQDLAVVPVLFAIGAMNPMKQSGGLATAVVQAVLAVLGIVALGRVVLRPLFRSVARTNSAELFVAACLLVVIATGLATAAAGLSMPLGALIGGLLLAGTEYRRQVEVTIAPFKGLFVGVFLISIGMSLDIRTAAANPGIVLGGIAAVLLLKLAVIAPLARVFGLQWGNGVQTGLLLGPGGEFGFVIVSVAAGAHVLARDTGGQVLFVTALTMAAIPALSWLGTVLAPKLTKTAVDPDLELPDISGLPRVIIAGFGRVGQTVAAMLDVHTIAYIAIDSDADRVAERRRAGKPVYWGDLTDLELLRRAHLDTARALVVTIDDTDVADTLVAGARAERADVLIVARARDAAHAAHLYRSGASDAVPETIEASLQLSEAVLVDMGVAMGPVIASIHEKRTEFQAAIKAMAPDADIRPLGRRRLRDR